MKPNSRKNEGLLKQFPFVSTILNLPVTLLNQSTGDTIQDLTIKVEKADGDLMFRKADNIGLVDNGCLIGTRGSEDGLVGKNAEYFYAVDEDGVVLNSVDWPQGRNEETGYPTYASVVFWKTKVGNSHYQDAIFDKTEHLVWVSVTSWHKSTGDHEDLFGEFSHRNVKVTIYRKPECGYYKLREESNVYDNLFLNTHTLTRGALEKDHDIVSINGALWELTQFFKDFVYNEGMREILDSGEYRGASGQFGPNKVLAAEMCGYRRFMLENNICWVSLQVRPGSSNMYTLGCGGTLPQIRQIIREVVAFWQIPENRELFKPDSQVSVM